MFVDKLKPPAPPEPAPEPLREVSTPEEAIEVFRELGAIEDAKGFLAGEPNRNPRWAVASPRSASALAVLQRARAAGLASRPPAPAPVCEPPRTPHPSEVRDLNALLALGVPIATAFLEKDPADYARLKREQASRLAHPRSKSAA